MSRGAAIGALPALALLAACATGPAGAEAALCRALGARETGLPAGQIAAAPRPDGRFLLIAGRARFLCTPAPPGGARLVAL